MCLANLAWPMPEQKCLCKSEEPRIWCEKDNYCVNNKCQLEAPVIVPPCPSGGRTFLPSPEETVCYCGDSNTDKMCSKGEACTWSSTTTTNNGYGCSTTNGGGPNSGGGTSGGGTSGSAACTADDTTAMTKCMDPLTDEMTKTPPTKDTICKYYQDVFACYPACYCDNDLYKDALEVSLKQADDAIKAMDGGECAIKCGSGSGAATCQTNNNKKAVTESCKCGRDSDAPMCAIGDFCWYDHSTCEKKAFPCPVINFMLFCTILFITF